MDAPDRIPSSARKVFARSGAETVEHRRPGRPRDTGADQAILEAVVALLAESGFSGLTIDAVAARAGVGKATIYRRWDGKEALVLDALSASRERAPVPNTGSVRSDLMALYEPMTEPVTQQTVLRLLPALAAQAAVNRDLADQLRAFVADRRAPTRAVLERGQVRGEVATDADVDLCIDLLTGPILYRLLFTGGPVDREQVRRAVDLVLRAVAPDDE